MAALVCLLAAGPALAADGVAFSQSAEEVDVFDYVEVTATVAPPPEANPFVDVGFSGQFAPLGESPVTVDGFCDAQDGSVFRVRFMPRRPGAYTYTLALRSGSGEARHEGTFQAQAAGRRGPVRVDPQYPWHFLWEGTGEHYYWNGTTTYCLLGWDDETVRRSLDRRHDLRVNRVRAVLNGRVKDGQAWAENVYPTDRFSFLLNPWLAARPDSIDNPGFDVTRLNVAHWQKYERLLRHARDLDMVVSVVFYVDGARPGVDPFGKAGMGGPDEQRYYRYAAARLAAFANVMWDVTNEYHLFRNEAWTNQMGAFLKSCDPYDHLASVHGHGEFPFRTSEWADFAMYQSWDEGGGYAFVRSCREKQAKAGRPMPQINEEYGYEDHYPQWGGNRKAPARSAGNRRRLAWGMVMAGGYQTTGERADTGTGWGPDTGGGWINGRGDDSMVMLKGYAHMVDFFTAIPWWTLEPDDGLVGVREESPVRTALSQLVYTRSAEGQAVLYVDGREVSRAAVTGDLGNWDDGFRLALANELTGDRPWLGTYRRVALFDRAWLGTEVGAALAAGPDALPGDALALYTFREGGGTTVKDVSGRDGATDLTITDGAAVTWAPPAAGGLTVTGKTLIATAAAASHLTRAVKASGAFALEAWVQPANTTQAGPARIVTLSKDPSHRNVTLGQAAGAYEVRFRTSATSPNGEPSLWSPGSGKSRTPLYALRAPAGDLAVVYVDRGGDVRLTAGRLAPGLPTEWYNPREGTWRPAAPVAPDTFRAPDAEDWVLLAGQRAAKTAADTRPPATAAGGRAAGPLRVSADNPRYFADPSGRIVYLTGSHTWANLKDMGPTNPPAPFDFDAYLTFLQRWNHNAIRLWTWELTRYAYGEEATWCTPFPWPRPGPGLAKDGLPRFDLSRLDDAYFARLRSRVEAAGQRGIYVSVMLFEGHGLHASNPPWCWDGHPFHPENNINGIDGDPDRNGRGIETQSLAVPAVTALQEAYVRRVVEALGDLDNVLYEIANESGAYSTEWQYHMVRFVKQCERDRPKQHPVGMTFQWAQAQRGTNQALFDSPADWVSPNPDGGYRDDPPPADGRKVVLNDTDHLWGIGGNPQWVWKSFLRGHNPLFMDPYARPPAGRKDPSAWTDHLGTGPQADPKWDPVRAAMGCTRRFAERLDLRRAVPRNEVASSGYCLAAAGEWALVFAPGGNEVTVDLTLWPGALAAEWFDALSASLLGSASVPGGERRALAPPRAGDAVLLLTALGREGPAPSIPARGPTER